MKKSEVREKMSEMIVKQAKQCNFGLWRWMTNWAYKDFWDKAYVLYLERLKRVIEKRKVKVTMSKMVQRQAKQCSFGLWTVCGGELYKLYNQKAESK